MYKGFGKNFLELTTFLEKLSKSRIETSFRSINFLTLILVAITYALYPTTTKSE